MTIPETKEKCISWFVILPEAPNPVWMTVVGARSAGTQPYFSAHLNQLSELRNKPDSAPI